MSANPGPTRPETATAASQQAANDPQATSDVAQNTDAGAVGADGDPKAPPGETEKPKKKKGVLGFMTVFHPAREL